MRRTIGISFLLCAALAAGVVGLARAHVGLVRSTPAEGERLSTSPPMIVLFFDEELDEHASRFQVYDANDQQVNAPEGHVDLSDPDHTRLIAEAMPTLPEGVYIVRWTALSTDGDGSVTEGEFDFIIGDAAPRAKPTAQIASPTPTIAAPTTPPTSDTNWLPAGIVIGVLVVLAIMGLALLGRRSG